MKRFDLYEKVKQVEIPNKSGYWGQTPHFEPYERIIKSGKYWNIVQVNDDNKLRYYLEHKYTQQRLAHTENDVGILGLQEINKSFTEYEQRPVEFQPGIQQPQHQPQPQVEQRKDNEPGWYEKFQEDSAKIEASFKAFSDQLEEKSKAIDFELATQKFSEIKSALDDFEQKLQAAKPKISLAEIRKREEKKEVNDTQLTDPTA